MMDTTTARVERGRTNRCTRRAEHVALVVVIGHLRQRGAHDQHERHHGAQHRSAKALRHAWLHGLQAGGGAVLGRVALVQREMLSGWLQLWRGANLG